MRPNQIIRLSQSSVFFLVCWWWAVDALGQPSFYRHPSTNSVSLGANVTNTVAAYSSIGTIEYQWLRDGSELPGCTAAKLVLMNVQVPDAGLYQARATDSNGSALSRSAPLVVDTNFTKVTKGPIVEDFEPSVGCAWGDVNGDGYVDLFVTNVRTVNTPYVTNALYLNNRDGTFTRVTTGPIPSEPPAPSHGCILADYDNDGWLDIFVANVGGGNFLYHNLGGGQFEKLSAARGGDAVVDTYRSVGPCWVDVDRDGWLDLFVPNGGITTPQQDCLYKNMRDGRLMRFSAGPPTEEVLCSMQAAVADYDGDGWPDLFVTHFNNQTNGFFRNNGDSTFQRVSGTPPTATTDRNDTMGAVWGDYDNDGLPDLFVTRWHVDTSKDALNALYHNLGNGNFEKITQAPFTNDFGGFMGCSWVDVDNDGFLDLFVAAYSGGGYNRRHLLYHNDGNGKFTRLTEGSLVNDFSSADGCAWADIDNDGFPDLFVANGSLTGPANNSLYRNNGNSNAWVKIRLVGTLSNRSAIGAKVRVKAHIRGVEQWQLREISAGSGFDSQDSLEALVGLGDAQVIDTIRVEWPSGVVQELYNRPARMTLDLVEPISLEPTVETDGGTVALKLQARTGRPLQVQASSDLVHWTLLGIVVPEINVLRVADPEASVAQSRFYRVCTP